jgi:hypothetical protein
MYCSGLDLIPFGIVTPTLLTILTKFAECLILEKSHAMATVP